MREARLARKPVSVDTPASARAARHGPHRSASRRYANDLPPAAAAVLRDGELAWPAFLRDFSPFLMACARRLASDYDERMEIYLHVCTRLRAEGCRRLRQFRGRGERGRCKFTTWLAAVVFNLGREWIRTHRGRRRYYRRVQQMSRLDRLVFRYRFWEGYQVGEITRVLRLNHAIHCDESRVIASLRRIRGQMGNDQTWRLLRRGRGSLPELSIDERREFLPGQVAEPRCHRHEPVALVLREAAVGTLRQCVSELPELERAVVTLRFRDGLVARQIAERLGIDNYKQVYELQARALMRLRRLLEDRGVSLRDFGAAPGQLELLR